jgi:hypothetical protein
MKKFNLHKIMSNAHKLYKNARAKYSTFASALKKAWSMAKFEVKIAAEKFALEAERKAEEARKAKARFEAAMNKPKAIEYYDWGNLTASDIYPDNNSGYLGSKYCGD